MSKVEDVEQLSQQQRAFDRYAKAGQIQVQPTGGELPPAPPVVEVDQPAHTSAETLVALAQQGLADVEAQRQSLQEKLQKGRASYENLMRLYRERNVELDHVDAIHRATLAAVPLLGLVEKNDE